MLNGGNMDLAEHKIIASSLEIPYQFWQTMERSES